MDNPLIAVMRTNISQPPATRRDPRTHGLDGQDSLERRIERAKTLSRSKHHFRFLDFEINRLNLSIPEGI